MASCTDGPQDVILGFGDTDPGMQFTLYQPDQDDGSPGDLLSLLESDGTPKTVVLKMQPRDASLAASIRTATVLETATPVANVGQGLIDWLATGGAPTPGDYRARVIVTSRSGHQETWPNGPDVELPDGSNPSYLWIEVGNDFPTPTP